MNSAQRNEIIESIEHDLMTLELISFSLCTKLKLYSDMDYNICTYHQLTIIRSKLKKLF